MATQPPRFPDSLTDLQHLDDITFWVIEVSTGKVCDKLKFCCDFMYLTHHSCAHQFENLLGITSVRNQCVHFYEITESGKLIPGLVLGWNCFDDDELLIAECTEKSSRHSVRSGVLEQNPVLSVLKHRIMSYLFRRAKADGSMK